jgi:DNA-3-methyladenine glycosylase II
MTPTQTLAAADPVLRAVIDATPLPVHVSTRAVFHDLMSCVVEQQIHYRSTKGTFADILARADLTMLTPGTFERFEEHGLPRFRLSAAKQRTVAAVADFFEADGNSDVDWFALSDADVRAQLGTILGIGSWTVDMILLYTLERPDVFPAGDYHLKQIVSTHYGLDLTSRPTSKMNAVSGAWRPHRSLAVRYLLAWKEYQQMSAL